MSKPHIIVEGMSGLGDNLHQRAVIRRMMQSQVVWLRTPWPSVYHDMVGPSLRLLRKATHLRTQNKNQIRQATEYTADRPPYGCDTVQVGYSHDGVRQLGSFLGAMAYQSNARVQVAIESFALPIPDAWKAKAQALLDVIRPQMPLMIYRPLVERREWKGNGPRNPDPLTYVDLAKSISSQFFVLSVADLSAGEEWLVSPPMNTNYRCDSGELDFETMAALFSMADLVYTPPGFALILAQAVGARTVGVFGGHESARFYNYDKPDQHFIQPLNPCECFRKDHRCDKVIPFSARQELKDFILQEVTT